MGIFFLFQASLFMKFLMKGSNSALKEECHSFFGMWECISLENKERKWEITIFSAKKWEWRGTPKMWE